MGKLLERRPTDPPGELGRPWSPQDAADTYGVRNWGKGYFGINERGHVTVHPDKNPDRAIDLKELVDQLQHRGIQLPLLLRFTDILQHRIGEIADAFGKSIAEFGYQGKYSCVYPIKVNQQRQVVEEVLELRTAATGLDSKQARKPELLAVMAVASETDDVPIICNGFKDDEYVEMAMLAQKMGRQISFRWWRKYTELAS